MERRVFNLPLSEIIPYEHNPRQNDGAVDAVAESIKAFGPQSPIIVDRNNVIICGHTLYKAAQKLGLDTFPCLIAENLSDEQVRAYRLADNKTAELSDWNEDMLQKELEQIFDLDMSLFGFELSEDPFEDEEEKYTNKVASPRYEITGQCPDIADLVKTDYTDELLKEIEQASISQEEKRFLKLAAQRHCVFDFRNIAEYYAHAGKEMQRLMERSALVIVDFGDAIKNGFTALDAEMMGLYAEEEQDG